MRAARRELVVLTATEAAALVYLPATQVGIRWLEGQRQHPADITFGATLGLFVTNLLNDAQSGPDRAAGIPGLDSRVRMSIGPALDGPRGAVGLH